MPRHSTKRHGRRGMGNTGRAVAAAAGAVVVIAGGWLFWPGEADMPTALPTELPGGALAATQPSPDTAAEQAPAVTSAVRPAAVDPALLEKVDAAIDAGDLLTARKLLAERLQVGDLGPAAAEPIKTRLATIADTVTFSPRPFADDPHQTTFTIPAGGTLGALARPFDVPWQAIARINGINPRTIRAGQTLKTPVGPFHAVVDKDRFTLDLYLGDPAGPDGVFLRSYRVGLGSDSSTPTGTWRLRPGGKLENPTWTNPRTGEVFPGDDPENPLGERWIALDGIDGNALGQQSYGIHGTIEPDSIGTNASMGCIRLLPDDVAEVYDYLKAGASTVRIVD